MFSRRKIAALVAEFLGTGVLAFVVLTVSRSQIGIPYFVAIAAGLTVLLFGLVLARDVQLNPAYTFALLTARRIRFVKAISFIAAQMLGGMAAYLLYKYFAENGIVQPLPDEYKAEILVAEAFGAFVFTFAASAVLARQANQLVRNVGTGAAYTIGVIVASVASAGFINPAVALANNGWGWMTYVAGPFLGAIIGVNLYSLLFADRERAGSNAVASATVTKSGPRSIRDQYGSDAKTDETKKKLNKDAIEVSPADVDDKPLSKVSKAERSAKSDKKSKNKKSKK